MKEYMEELIKKRGFDKKYTEELMKKYGDSRKKESNFNEYGVDINGQDKDGYNINYVDKDGLDKDGYNINGIKGTRKKILKWKN